VVGLTLDEEAEVETETETEVELEAAALEEDEDELLELDDDALAEVVVVGAAPPQRPRIPSGSIKQPRFSTAPA